MFVLLLILCFAFCCASTSLVIIYVRYSQSKNDLCSLTDSLAEKSQELSRILNEKNNLLNEVNRLNIENARIVEKFNASVLNYNVLNDNYQELETQLSNWREKYDNVNCKLSEVNASNPTMEKNLHLINDTLLYQFKNIASTTLNESNQKFGEHSKDQLNTMISPLADKLKTFQSKMEECFNIENKERFSLKEAIQDVIRSNENIKNEASKLSNTLKGNRLILGHWGEIVLENILNSSGLRKDEDYLVQSVNSNNQDDKELKLKPDVLIKLPDDKFLIIDSKISFFDYDAYENIDNNDSGRSAIVGHFVSKIKNHIDTLASKEYHNMIGFDTPEITLMFIPVESWYNILIKHSPEIYNFAWNKNIALVSPSTLKTISYIWKCKTREKNSTEIAAMGGRLYDSLVEFTEMILDMGRSIEKMNSSYEKLMSKLKYGKGNLIGRAEKMRILGAKNNKLLNQTLLNNEDKIGQAVEFAE